MHTVAPTTTREGDAVSEQEQEQTQEPETQEQDGPEPDAEPTPIQAPDEEEEAAEEQEAASEQGEGVPEQPEGLSQKQLEQAFGKLERETERHSKRVAEIMGEDAAMLSACPLCDPLIPGFVMPTPATPERFPLVRQFMGDAEPEDWQPDPQAHRCETCHGYGVVETGSLVQGQERLPCQSCKGFGWTGPRGQAAGITPPAPAVVAAGNGPPEARAPGIEPPEAAKLRELGFTLIPPVGAGT